LATSFTTKTGRHDTAEILLKVALKYQQSKIKSFFPLLEKERKKKKKEEQKKKYIILSNIILFISTFAIYIFEDVY
jgi:hypothetical protein